MSALSQAGKGNFVNKSASITNEINRAFTKGLVGVDPSELERKQQQRRIYQQELRKQAEQTQRRKAEQKRKLQEQDERLQRKIEMDYLKQKQQKQNAVKAKQSQQQLVNNANLNNNQNINTNTGSNNRNIESANQRKGNLYSQSSQNIVPKLSLGGQQMNLLRNIVSNVGKKFINIPPQQQSLYPVETRNTYNYEQEKYYQQEIQNRARRFKETLDRKLDQVYQQIESSKKQQVGDNVIDEIRRRLKSNSYLPPNQDFNELQKSGLKQFEEEFSQFYRIPKKQVSSGFEANNRTVRNLDYEAQSKFSSRMRNYPEPTGTTYNSRVNTERAQKTQYDNSGAEGTWGLRGKKNFLGNRQALDYQLESKLTNIEDIINAQTKTYGQ